MRGGIRGGRRGGFLAATVLAAALPAWAADAAGDKAKLPTTAEIKAATGILKDVFQNDIQAAKKPDEKKAVAKKLIASARGDTGASKYVQLTTAKDLAIEGADVEDCLTALDEIVAGFDVDPVKYKAEVFPALARANLPPDGRRTLGLAIAQVLDAALADDRFDVAKTLADTAASNARLGTDPELLKIANTTVQTQRDTEAAYAGVKTQSEVLEKIPGDAGANFVVGKYRCYYKGDWKTGLPMLALGDDQETKKLAKKELAATTADDLVAAADAWWDTGMKQTGLAKTRVIAHAASIYHDVSPLVEGLNKTKVDKRLEEADALLAGDSAGLPAKANVTIYTEAEFRQKAANFPATTNVASKGIARATSFYGTRNPNNVLKGSRTGDSWTLNGPSGTFEANWPTPVKGQYILLFCRTATTGADPWGTSTVVINGTLKVPLENFSDQHIAVLDLGKSVAITSVRIFIDGKTYPGLAGLEIHPKVAK